MSVEIEPEPQPDRRSVGNPVSWLELFYDLVFVAAVVAFSNAITHHPTWGQVLWVATAFGSFWFVWFGTTFCFNRDRRDTWLDRTLVVVQMVALSVAAVSIASGPDLHPVATPLMFSLALATLGAMTWRSMSAQPGYETYLRIRSGITFALAAMYLIIAILPNSWFPVLWVVGFVVLFVTWIGHFLGSHQRVPPLDQHHLSERLGLLTIIVLGESFVKLAIVASGDKLERFEIEVAIVMFITVFAIFWAYFDDVPEAGFSPIRIRRLGLFLGHLLMQAGCIGLAIGLASLTSVSSRSMGWTAGGFAWGSVALVYVGLALIGPGTRRTPIAGLTVLRVATAALLIVLVPIIALASWFDPSGLAFVIAAIGLAHAGLSRHLRRRTHLAPVTRTS